MVEKRRADQLLVEQGLAESRAKAQALILAGLVSCAGRRVDKPGEQVAADATLTLRGREHPWVSRGGIKLAAALDQFHLDVTGRICLDVGASTGGFSEVLATRGAKRVYAVDVGTGQLHPRLAARSEIVSMEQTDIRTLDPARLAEPPDLAVVDVSFISLKLVLPAIGNLLRARATIVALIKPQFEAARAAIKKGIVRDPAVHAAVCDEIAAVFTAEGWRVSGVIPSPIPGGDGNREFLIEAERG